MNTKKGVVKRNLSTGIYVRVSTEEQAQEGFSIRGQTEKLKQYALLKEWDIFDIYADEGISGKNLVDRPAINRLIDDIENGNVNNVLVFKVDRLTRSTKNLLELTELFEDYNCNFNSLTESIDTETPSGRMFLKIIGIFAEFERENISMRVRLGFERKVKEGYTLATNIITYGYIRESGQKVQTINPDEEVIVKEIFSMFLDKNMSMNGIAKNLNNRKIPTKLNASWGGNTIRTILTNPTYIGKVRYSTESEDRYFEADGHHEAIISDELFYLAQEKISRFSNTIRTKRPREESYFCGVLICGMCGSKFSTHNYNSKGENGGKQAKTAYRCHRKKSCNAELVCKCPAISHTKMEIAFVEYINNINDLTEKSSINSEELEKNKEHELLKRIVDCEKRISILQSRKNESIERYMQGNIEFDDYKKMVDTFNKNYDAVEEELQDKKAEFTHLSKPVHILPQDIITNIQQNWGFLDNSERMIFMQRFIKSITITVEKERHNSNIVTIQNIEFNSCELEKKVVVRSRLRGR